MWTSADEYLEEMQKEFENNDVEFLRNKIENLKEVIKRKDKQIEFMKDTIRNTHLKGSKCGENTFKESWDISSLRDKILDEILQYEIRQIRK